MSEIYQTTDPTILNLRAESDRLAQDWKFVARWVKHDPTGRNLADYRQDLPKFDDRDFFDHLEEKLQGKSKATFLDIGCGQGICAAKIRQRHPEVGVYGISARDFRPNLPDKFRENVAQVDYRVGGAHSLDQVFREINFDIIVGVRSFEYFADPLYVLAQAYSLLNPGGIIFIDHLRLNLRLKEKQPLEKFWGKEGVNAQIEWPYPEIEETTLIRLAIQKGNAPQLPLPFRYSSRVKYGETYGLNFPQLSYLLTLA